MHKSAHIELSQDELLVVINCLNEAVSFIEDWEFETRIGVDPAVARLLHGRLLEQYDALEAA